MREAKRAALFVPTISEGIAQSARADASHASGRRCEASCPHHFCPCGVVQPTCLPLTQEITGAKPVRDTNSIAPNAFSAMHSLGKRISSVQFRVGALISLALILILPLPISIRGGVVHENIPRGFPPPCSSLWISFVKKSCRGSTGWRLHFTARVVQQQRHDVESVASAGANPAASTIFWEIGVGR